VLDDILADVNNHRYRKLKYDNAALEQRLWMLDGTWFNHHRPYVFFFRLGMNFVCSVH
jgi:hypothetical protein